MIHVSQPQSILKDLDGTQTQCSYIGLNSQILRGYDTGNDRLGNESEEDKVISETKMKWLRTTTIENVRDSGDRNEGNNPDISPFYRHSSSSYQLTFIGSLCQEVCVALHMHNPTSFVPPLEVACDSLLFYFAQLHTANNCQKSDFNPRCIWFHSICSLHFPTWRCKSNHREIEFTFFGELGGIFGVAFSCVLWISGCGSAFERFVALFNFT